MASVQDYKRRIKFQADVQDFVDQSISGTINLPSWGTDLNNEDTVKPFAETLACYARFPPVKAALQGGLDIALVDHS